jgi:prepilin peptidase CpaA
MTNPLPPLIDSHQPLCENSGKQHWLLRALAKYGYPLVYSSAAQLSKAPSSKKSLPHRMLRSELWMFCILPALIAGFTDWRSRRIPNWLTVSALLVGIVANASTNGWPGAKSALLGALLGLAILLPFVLIRALGAGDWKLVGALGAWLGPSRLIAVLIVTIFVAGIMAVILVIWKRRLGQTLRNIGHMIAAIFTLHLPGPEVSLDNPDSAKVPFGVAVAVSVVLYVGATGWRIIHLGIR